MSWKKKASEGMNEAGKGGWSGDVLYHLSLKAEEKVRENMSDSSRGPLYRQAIRQSLSLAWR